MVNSSKPLLLFDMDGTLLDTRGDIARAANLARGKLGLPSLDVGEIIGAVGDGVNQFVSRTTFHEEHPRFQEAKRIFLTLYAENLTGETKPYAGIVDMLVDLQKLGYTMGVVSNKPFSLVDSLIRHFNWETYFLTWLGGDSAAEAKPSAAPLFLARERCGLSPLHNIVMIGDGTQDVMAARAAKCRGIWVRWGFNETMPAGENFDVVQDPKSLLSLLAGS